MNIEAIKNLVKNGDIPQASEQLREILAKTPEDAAARMLYGTCCQLMGDSATFGRIYRDLAPQMEPRVTRGERSELVSMWLKYAAMFAMLLMCGSQLWATEDYCATFDDDDAQAAVMSAGGENGEFGRVMKMTPRDRLLYFLERPEVSRELRKGNARAIFIPLRENGIGWFSRRADNLLLIRADSSLTTASAVVKALKDTGSEKVGNGEVFVQFSPFEQIVDPKSVERLVSRCKERIKSQEERVRRQEKIVEEQEERVRLQEEETRSIEASFEDHVREKKLLEDEELICKIEEQIRTVDDRIRKRDEFDAQAHRLDEYEEELRTLENRKEVIRSVLDIEKQKQSLEERRKEKLTPPEADEIEKRIRAIDDQVRDMLGKNSIGRRRVSLPRQLLDLQQRVQDLSEKIKWIKSESSKGVSVREELKAERGQLEAQRQQLLPKRRELTSERRKIEVGRQNLELEHRKLKSERRELESARETLNTTRIQAQAEIECLQNGEMISHRYKSESLPITLRMAIKRFQMHGDIADVVLPYEEKGYLVLGISDEVRRVNNVDYGNIMQMPLRDKMLYFLKRPEVSHELHLGDSRACVIPLQLPKELETQENLLLIRVKNSLKAGREVVKALKEKEELLVNFSSFEYASNPDPADWTVSRQIRCLMEELEENQIESGSGSRRRIFGARRKTLEAKLKELELLLYGGEMIPTASSFSEISKDHSLESRALDVVFRTVEEYGDISDLIVSSEDPDWLILGVCFVNVHGRMARTKYAGPRDYGDRFPKYIKTPDGTVLQMKVRVEPRTAYGGPRFKEKPPRFEKRPPVIIDDDDFD